MDKIWPMINLASPFVTALWIFEICMQILSRMFNFCYHRFSVHGMLRRHHFEWYIKCWWCGHRVQPCCKIKNLETFFSWQVLWVIVKIYARESLPQNGICVGAWQARHCVHRQQRSAESHTLCPMCTEIQLKELARVIWGSHSHLISWPGLLPTKVLNLQFYNECNCQARQSNIHPIWAHTWYSLVSWCMCPRNKLIHPQVSLHWLHYPHPSQWP